MAAKDQLINNTLIYTVGSLGSKILVFLLLPLYSFYLSKEELGIYDLILVSVNLTVPVVTFQLSEAVYRWLISANKDFQLTVEANGIYAIASKFPLIITIFNSIFMLSWQDHLLQDKEKDSEFQSKIFNVFFTLELSVIIFLICSSEFLVNFLFGSDYFESWKYMPFLYLATGFSVFSAYYGAYYLKEKKTKSIFYTTFIGGFVNLGISISLIKWIGLYAPALGTLRHSISKYNYSLYIDNHYILPK
jgi:O-antigen/teichoic acid export membrane protein